MGRLLFERHPDNPILTPSRWPYPIGSVFNPGATWLPDGRTLLLVRAEDRQGISHLTVATSRDGLSAWAVSDSPAMAPMPDVHPEEAWGIEDPRVVELPELDRYAVTYTAYSDRSPTVSLSLTKDFDSFERRGPLLLPENKDAALFPRRIRGRWALISRPVPLMASAKPSIWLSYSSDLVHWGDHRLLIEPRQGEGWDADRVGLGCPPIETDEGWLLVYHGVRRTGAGAIYRAGLALLDLEDPGVVTHRGLDWVLSPETPYEITGNVPNVVFPCGAVRVPEDDVLRLYYGAADTVVGVASGRLSELTAWVKRFPVKGACEEK